MAVYEQVSTELAAMTKFLNDVWEKVGKPDDCSTEAGWAVMKACVKAWESFYPEEAADWMHDRDIDLKNERSLQAHAKGFGYNMAGFPPTLYQMLKILLPGQDLKERKFLKRLTHDFPLFKTTNLKL